MGKQIADRVMLAKALAKMIKAKVYMELGVRQGDTINEMIKVVPRCIGVDINKKFQHLYDKRVEFHVNKTDDFCKTWTDTLDMVFIDADHSYQSSYNDFLNYKDFVVDHGFILLHDTCPCNEEMIRPVGQGALASPAHTAMRIKTEHAHECELVTLPDGCGLSIVRMNRGKQLTWGDV